MRLATVEQSRRIDQLSQSTYGLSGEILMEAAGALSAREIEQNYFPELRREGTLAVICGPGNNGADGLVVARHLSASGHKQICLILAAPSEKRSALFKTQLERCEKQSLRVLDALNDGPATALELAKARLVIDAIFGIGFWGPIAGPLEQIIHQVNSCKAPVVSLDTPTGLDADRGTCAGAAIKADLTLTYGLAKPGFFISEGPRLVGRLRALAIGFPLEARKREAISHFAFTEKQATRALPRRNKTSHKSDHGHSLILAGSRGMWGASVLSASSAYRIGSGYVTVGSSDDPGGVLAQAIPEALTTLTSDEKLWGEKRKWTAAGIGPGLGTGPETKELLLRLRSLRGSRVVVDADAITVLANNKDLLPLPADWVLTPHAGELSRVLSANGAAVSAKDIEADRFRYAVEASKLTGAIVVLKGFRTVVAQGERAWVILAGNAALAKAGTGDVLTGMITGLLAQKVAPLKAACTAAYIHGRIADEWVRAGRSSSSLEASDLREILPTLLSNLAARHAR